ncbi:hypothetical protein Syun_030118 [Stephania yunnanensis]|uniref:Uncharacterized protein n=1 Tax=Stephania yunnanensis TaxID=152371 RepID=A0AAP0E6Y4_9MAGN
MKSFVNEDGASGGRLSFLQLLRSRLVSMVARSKRRRRRRETRLGGSTRCSTMREFEVISMSIDGPGVTRLIYGTRIVGMSSPRTRKEDKEKGFAVVIRSSTKDEDGQLKYVWLLCDRGRNTYFEKHSKMVNCPAKIRAIRGGDNRWLVSKMKGIARVHERYIMRKWMKDVLRRHLSIIHSGGYPKMTDEYKKFKEIERALHESVDLCTNNPARLGFLKTEMEVLIERVKNYNGVIQVDQA